MAPPIVDSVQEGGDARPWIDAGNGDLEELGDLTLAALHKAEVAEGLYEADNRVVQVSVLDGGAVEVTPISADRLRHIVARETRFYTDKGKLGRVRAHPPTSAIRDVLARPDPAFRLLKGISRRPIVKADRTIVTVPGYDPDTGLLLIDSGLDMPEVPLSPTPEQLKRACDVIRREVLDGFPFEDDADVAHVYSGLLSPILRIFCGGRMPMHAITKPCPGTGASLLVDVMLEISVGCGTAMMALPASEGEMQKTILAKARQLPSAIVFDNCARLIDSPSLAAAITAGEFEGRSVGHSRMLRATTAGIFWVATGNHLRLSLEMARRTVLIRLKSPLSQPWLRSGFRHADLLVWVKANRGLIVQALLTMVSAYFAAGATKSLNAPVLGSFEAWSSTMAGVLEVAGIPGFMGNTHDLYSSCDPAGEAMQKLVAAWWTDVSSKPTGVADVFSLAERVDLNLGSGSEKSRQTRLGILLRDYADRQFIIDGRDGEKLTVSLTPAGHGTGSNSGARLWALMAQAKRGEEETEELMS